jgi:hypothetical protein
MRAAFHAHLNIPYLIILIIFGKITSYDVRRAIFCNFPPFHLSSVQSFSAPCSQIPFSA